MSVTQVQAITFHRTMSKGRTQPALFTCRAQDNTEQDYVVKFYYQLGKRLVCELMAALLGQQLNLPIPPIAIVNIDPRLIPVIKDSQIQKGLKGDQGPHFGSLFQTGGHSTLATGYQLPSDYIPQMTEIFAFDALTQNPDRSSIPGKGKPNMIFDGEQLTIFDHELAFSFIDLIISPSAPWNLRGEVFVQDHIFYSTLSRSTKDGQVSFDDFLSKFNAISDDKFDEMVAQVPQQWLNPTSVEKIVNHLKLVRSNLPLFKRGLLEALQ